jgi:hypothetical protein
MTETSRVSGWPAVASRSAMVAGSDTSQRRCRRCSARKAPCRCPSSSAAIERFEDLAPLGPFHRRADRKAVEHRGRAARDDNGVMGHQRGQERPEDRGARMGVTLHMVGVDVDDAGNEDRAVEVEGSGNSRAACRDPRDAATLDLQSAADDAVGVTIRALRMARLLRDCSSNMGRPFRRVLVPHAPSVGNARMTRTLPFCDKTGCAVGAFGTGETILEGRGGMRARRTPAGE